MKYIKHGWPEYERDISDPAKSYYNCIRNQLSVYNDIVVNCGKIAILVKLHSDMLVKIHSGHQGVIKCCERANENLWWPRISKDIEMFVKSCTVV